MMRSEPRAPAAATDASGQLLLERLFILVRTLGSHGADQPMTAEAVQLTQRALDGVARPFALQFVREACFIDRKLLFVEVEGFLRVQWLSKALSNLNIHEITVIDMPPAASVLTLGQAIARGAQGPSEVLSQVQLDGLTWRAIDGAGWDTKAAIVDVDVFADNQVHLAVLEAEKLRGAPDVPWPWQSGIAVLRRIERGCDVSVDATARAIEMVPGRWPASRRMVGAAFRTMSALREIGANRVAVRAAGHATLALGSVGFGDGLGLPPQRAARVIAKRLLLPSESASAAGHRLSVTTLVHGVAQGAHGEERARGVLPLLTLVHELEQQRQPAGVDFQLTFADLLGIAVGSAGAHYDAAWVRAVVAAAGEIPAGAHVRLHDGRMGIVMERNPNGQALMPLVLVQGQIVTPTEPVSLIPPVSA